MKEKKPFNVFRKHMKRFRKREIRRKRQKVFEERIEELERNGGEKMTKIF